MTRVLREKEDLRDRISTVDQHTDQLAVAHAQSTPERDREATDRRRDDRDHDHYRDAKGYDRDDKDGLVSMLPPMLPPARSTGTSLRGRSAIRQAMLASVVRALVR